MHARLNSTMVRLKQLNFNKTEEKMNGLNSTMVRLKQNGVVLPLHFFYQSQFHYGSIKTEKLEEKPLSDISLNSTMVRLKLNNLENLRNSVSSLNSTMVRLKPQLRKTLITMNFCLNSTMVRLKLL